MHSFAWWPTLIVLSVATFTDLRNRRIPNWLVVPFMVLGLIASAWLHGWHGLGQAFAGLGLGTFAVRISFLDGWYGSRRREAGSSHRRLDRPQPTVLCTDCNRHGRRNHGPGLGSLGRFLEWSF
jgi:prepilin signal peptidase PulO-like enzyme (type II secretory pathway)